MIPCFAAEYAASAADEPTSPATDETLTIAPPPRSSIAGISARIPRKTPVRFDVDHAPPLVLRDLRRAQLLVERDPRVVHRPVEAAVPLDCDGDRALQVLGVTVTSPCTAVAVPASAAASSAAGPSVSSTTTAAPADANASASRARSRGPRP